MHKRLENEFEFLKKLNTRINTTIKTKRECFEHLLCVFKDVYDQVDIEISTYSCTCYMSEVKFTHRGVVGSHNKFEINYIEMDDVLEGSRKLFEYIIEKFNLEAEPEKRMCENCKHNDEPAMGHPCIDCWGANKWEPKEEKKEEPKNIYIDSDMANMYPKFEYKHDSDNFDALRYLKRQLNAIYGAHPSSIPGIKDVKFNNPATIVFWADGTKTVVRCQDGEAYDPEKGLAMAISKKALGNTREYYHTFLHELKKVKKNSESVKLLVCSESIRKGIETALKDAGSLHCNKLTE